MPLLALLIWELRPSSINSSFRSVVQFMMPRKEVCKIILCVEYIRKDFHGIFILAPCLLLPSWAYDESTLSLQLTMAS